MQELRALVEEGGVVLVALDDELGPWPSRQDWRKFSGTPPIRNEGSRPASASTCASSEEVVVLPWVPATTTEWRSVRKSSESSEGNDVSGMPRSWRRAPRRGPCGRRCRRRRARGPSRGSRRGTPRTPGWQLGELRRHGRIDVLVRAPHVMTGGPQQTRERSHAGAADSDEVYFHDPRSDLPEKRADGPGRSGGARRASFWHALGRTGLELVANFLTSIVKVTLKSAKSPSRRRCRPSCPT